MKHFKEFCLLTATLFLGACSLNKIATRQTARIINKGLCAFYNETDTKLARESMPANLKLMEVLLENDRNNPILLTNLSQGYCAYSFMFIEDENKKRASLLYKKGIEFSRRALAARRLISGKEIVTEKINRKNIPPVFWHVFCKAAWINLNIKEPDALVEIPKIIPAARRIEEIYPSYYHNGIFTILATFYARRPRLLGGDPEKAKKYFQMATSGAGSDFLLNKYMYAKIYSVLVQDEALFDRLLKEIDKAGGPGSLPLANSAAKEKAKKLKERKNELF